MRRHAIALSTLALLAGSAFAGSLTPPPGPVATTMKTLSDIEPRTALSQATTPGDFANQFKITQPGSYYLAGDMTLSPGANPCILITASDVTLDLSGFSVRAAAAEGIRIGGDRVTVRNGSVALLPGSADGVYVLAGADDSQLLNVKISAPSGGVRVQSGVANFTMRDSTISGGQYGVVLSGGETAATLVNVDCHGQSHNGLDLSQQAVVEGCTIRNIGNSAGVSGFALYVGAFSTVRNTTILDNPNAAATFPVKALVTGTDCTVDSCTVVSRGTVGMGIDWQSTVRDCTIKMGTNGGTGITVTTGDAFIADNKVSAQAGTCIALGTGTGSTVVRNHLLNATTAIGGSNLTANVIGPAASNGNPTVSTNPHANFVN